MDKLLPCPLCGESVYLSGGTPWHRQTGPRWRLTHLNTRCFRIMTGFFTTKEQAIKAWNTRHTYKENKNE